MKRWRPLTWLLLSVACFIAAFYFWRLGDKLDAEKPAAPGATVASNAPAAATHIGASHTVHMGTPIVKPASTAPIVTLNPTNGITAKRTNAFPYRLSNTTQTVGQLSRNSHAILLENALIDSSNPTALQVPDSLRAHGDPGAYIVQAHGPLTDAFRAQLEAAGATIVSYIPNNAYLVRASAGAAVALGQNATVTPWEPYFKVKTVLMPTALAGGGVPQANLAVFSDSLEETIAALNKLNVTVVSQSRSPFGTELAVQNVSSIADVAQLSGVQEVEPSYARMAANDLTRVIMSDSADVFTNQNYLGLSGSNVWVAVADSWIPTNGPTIFNPDLMNIVTPTNYFPVGFADTVGHATHVGGIIASAGVYSPSNAVGSQPGANFRGKAPLSTLLALPALTPAVSDADLQKYTALSNAPISNNSWAYGTSDYNLAAASYDQAVRDSLPGATGSQQVIYVFAAGNNGGGTDDGRNGSPDTLLSPAVAKNVISVGATELPRGITNLVTQCDSCNDSNTPVCTTNQPWAGMTDSSNQVARFSSRGNVGIGVEGDFGRFKPDLVAPGTFVVSTRSMTWDTNAYYNPVTVDDQPFSGDIIPTNDWFNYSIFVPCDATQLVITASSISPRNITLPIYVRAGDFAQVPGDFVANNFVSIPPLVSSPLSPVDTFWYYAVANLTNVPVTITTDAQVTRTNEMGDYFDVLRTNLNDQLITTNPPNNGKVLYRYESGTSMAAPAVAGTLALMEDFFTNQWHYTPSPALMKALLINGARSLPDSPYDFQVKNDINYQGWGMVNLTNSLPANLTNAFDVAAPTVFLDQDPTNALATGEARTLFVNVNSNAQINPMRITLVWTDPPGNPAAGIKLVNNLDLIVTNLDNPTNPIVYFGNDFPPGSVYSSQWDGDTNSPVPSDNINNVENVFIPGVLGTNYSITVIAREVNVNAVTAHTNGVVQDYALVISADNGEITNALTLTNGLPIPTYPPTLTTMTNEFPASPDISGGVLLGQHVGASSPLQGTNTLSLGAITQDNWANNGQITLGVSNQWHFYVITNAAGTNGGPFTNAAFATFLPPNLSIPPVGVNATDPNGATRPEADIDLFVARGSTASNLLVLDPATITTATKSLGRGGEETIIFSNALPNEVFYIGVKAEDQEAAEYAFLALFSRTPFSDMDDNGIEYLHGLNVPTDIPDGTPEKVGIATTIAIGVQPINIRRVVVTNIIEHQNFGDLFGSLSHVQAAVVLNNHSFGNGTTNQQQLIYEDNDEGDIPGSQHPDGPGTLKNFIGQQGAGVWVLREEDNTEFNTGRVDNVFIRLDPQQDTNGVKATIQPGHFFYDYIDVPPAATNMTVCVNFLNGSLGPVQLYLLYGSEPTTTSYDYTKLINAPGDCLTVGQTDIPPLRPGRYFVGIYNPTAVAQTVRLTWTFGLNNDGVTPTSIVDTNGITQIPDDAVTNNTIIITNPQPIVSINVGVVLQHPRISDLDLTLISPTGQRILLFENRGGLSATNMGHLNIFTNFFGSFQSGGPTTSTNIITPGINPGTLVIDYNFFQVPDQMDVYDGSLDIFSSGFVSGAGTFTIPFNLVNGNTLTIVMNKGNNPVSTTQWEYTPRIVSQDYTYLTFTDDTNLTDMPIKYAIPPYDSIDNGTNFTLSDFEQATNGQYFAPTNIFDSFGGWTMTTNDIFVRTNYFAGTNLLNMATNEVSVVTDPAIASSGSNYLALANGSISRVISLTPGKNYTINYVYRGPGIAGWYRGEGNAADSGDPESLGNNGSLIGRFNFPAGEVGQAFAMADSGIAFQFAGTNTYVQVRQSPTLDVGQDSGFTVEGWINPTNVDFQQPLVEWLAKVPTNSVVNGQGVSNLVVAAGPFLNRANGHYYYMLGQTNWATSELWANALGGHLVEVNDDNEQNWIYDTFANFGGGTNFTLWIGLTNDLTGQNFSWSTGDANVAYTNWDIGQPTNCGSAHYVAILGATNAHPGTWTMLDNNGVTCSGVTNKPFGVVEVNEIQTNGVQFWISVTNAATPGNGRLYANIFDTNGVPHEFFSPPGLIQSNMYQHVALTYNTNTGVANFYYSGTNVATTNLGVFVPKTGGDVLIGKDMSRITNNFFWGEMDEMSIYGRFLSPAEITSIYRISATTTNRNIGKFDPAITPAESLAEAQVSFADVTNLIYGVNNGWQVQGFSLKAQSNSLPVQITGLEPGVLLDSFSVAEQPPGNLYYLPEQPLDILVGSNANGSGIPNDPGTWTLEIRDARTGAVSTNAELISWELQFVLLTNTPAPIQLNPQSPGTNTVPPGQIAYFQVFVPSWANFATNLLVSSTAPVDLLFNQSTPPGTGSPNDFTFVANNTSGKAVISANPPSTPPLMQGQTYYLGVRNNGTTPATVVVEVDFNMVTLANGVPYTSLLNTNDLEQPFVFNVTTNASEATFQLLKLTGNADLVLRKGLPLPNLLSADYGSFAGSNSDETIYVLTNSLPVPLSAGPWYLDVIKRALANDQSASNTVRFSVLAKELDGVPNVITLTNRVPYTFTNLGPGADLTNFFKFSVTNFPLSGVTNLGIHFEVFNQTGDGDLTVQTNALPLFPPFLQTSQLPGNTAEIVFIHTNSALTNLDADWYLGVPNNETNPINFTILAQIDTNTFPSFPTAEGSGASTRGGALGTNVYHVTTLADSGQGSLRDAVSQTNGAETVVFDTFGTINLLSPLYITNSSMTIAGQTAPGDGITIAGAPTIVQDAHDLIIRYLRFRPDTNSININGSFENPAPSASTYFAGQTFGGWTVLSGSVDDVTVSNGGWQAADGLRSLDMNGFTAGAISRTVPTVPGKRYNLRFAYAGNPDDPDGGTKTMQVSWGASLLATVSFNIADHSDSNMGWTYTNFTVVGTGSDLLEFASTTTAGLVQFGPTLDAVSLTSSPGNSLQVTNASNVIFDHISAEFGDTNDISVLNSSNVTVQWSVIAESQDQTDSSSGGSVIRYGSGDVTFHHNLYADNYSGSPTIGEDVSLDFVNNVIFNWGMFAGLSTNDLANNPGGLTNFLNYSANYLIAGSNSVFTNVAFWGGTPDTWIFQTNNFIDTNGNSIVDGANTSWAMFSNKFTEFSHPFEIPPTAPDEAFIAYERVLDFAGTSLFKRDSLDRGIVQRVRLQPANTNTAALLSGMISWWQAENNANDYFGINNGTLIGGLGFAPGEVGQAFNFNNANAYVSVPQSSSLDVSSDSGFTIETWINPSTVTSQHPLAEWNPPSPTGAHFWISVTYPGGGGPGCLYANLVDTANNSHIVASVPGLVQPNVFQHVALTYDKTSGNAVLYYNGTTVATANFGSINVNSKGGFLIGQRAPTGENFAGLMDELSLYNRALSPCEIAAIYNAGSLGKQSILSGTGSTTNTPTINLLPYLDIDRDGIPDFWEITLGENPTNYSPNLDRDGDGYTDLEEYMNWLGVPHALTITNTQVDVDLYALSGNTGNLLFGVSNGTNGTVYLTNSCTGIGPDIAVFTPTNNFGFVTNGGFASFNYMVTNLDTRAYFGPVTVSVFVSSVPITNAGASTNIVIFTNPPPDMATTELVPFSYTNGAVDSDTNATITYTVSTVINTNAVLAHGWPLTNLTIIPSPTIDANGIISWTPTEAQGPGVYTITTIATDNGIPPAHATNSFNLTVNETNMAPFWPPGVPNPTNYTILPLTTLTVTNTAVDLDIPYNPLSYTLLNPPAGATIDTNGIFTWTPTVAEAPGVYIITNVVTDTNPYALANNNLSATNYFMVTVLAPHVPFAFTQPAQGVTGSSAQLNGMATPNGLAATAWYQWGTNTLYGNTTPAVNVGNSFNVQYVPTTITGLITNVPYHFRLVVSNLLGVAYGFDQTLDEAKVVVWGANYVRQAEVPPGLSNVVAIAGAYDHSLALRNNGTVVAWGDSTFGQTNVPPGLNNVLAIAGGQYSSMALKAGGTVAAWGGNILSVTNVPASLNNVIMISGGTYASLALQNNGNIVSWGANFFGLTNVPAGLTNVVEVAGGSYHSLAIRNDGTIVAWGDNSAGQTNVPVNATNVVAIAGGNYHSLALRNDGTVVAWGDDSSGQIDVPPGLSNVVAVAAGGFHSLALKSDGSVIGWGDNTAGQSLTPASLTNVVAISSGYFHSLALTPTLLSTNPIVLTLTNNEPQTNSVLGDGLVFYRVDVPTNVDAATNMLLFTVNGGLNIWYTTNTPPTVGNLNDFQLMTNAVNGTSVVDTASSPLLVPGTTYYLGVQNTNNFSVSYVLQVDFHFFTNSAPITNAVPISTVTYTNINGTNGFLLVWYAPTNDYFMVQWSPGLLGPYNTFTNIVGYHTFITPTNSEFQFFDDGTQTGGFSSPRFYQLILLTGPPPLPLPAGTPTTGTVPADGLTFYQVNVPTNADFGTNQLLSAIGGPLNVWFSTNNPPTITNSDDFLLITNALAGTSQLSSNSTPLLVPGSTYYLGLQNTNATPVTFTVQVDFHLVTNATPPLTNAVPISTVTQTNINGTNGFLLVWYAPTNDYFMVQWSPGLLGPYNTFTNIVGYHTFISPTNSEFQFFDDGTQTGGFSGGRFYRLILLAGPPPPVLPVGTPVTNSAPSNTVTFYQVNVPTNADFGTNLLLSATGPLNLWFSTNNPPTVTNADDFLLLTNVTTGASVLGTNSPRLIPGGSYYLGVQNTNATAVSYTVEVDFHLVTNAAPPLTNAVPISTVTQTNINGTNGFLLVWYAPTNDYFMVQWSPDLLGPYNTFTNIVGYHTFISPTNSEFQFFDDGSQTGGFSGGRYYRLILLAGAPPTNPPPTLTNAPPISSLTPTNNNGTNGFLLVWYAPTNALFQVQWSPGLSGPYQTFTNIIGYHTFISPTNSEFQFFDDGSQTGGFTSGRFYRLILLGSPPPSTNAPPPPLTNAPPISTVTQTNNNGTNGFLLVWYAPTNALFQVQWSTGLLGPYSTFTNIIGYHTFISPTNSEFQFFDDGSQTGGVTGGRFYRLILLNGAAIIPPLAGGTTVSNAAPSGSLTFYQVAVPTNADFGTNLLLSATGPVNLWFSTNNPPTVTNADDFVLLANSTAGSSTLSTNTPRLVPGGTYYLGVQNNNASAVTYSVRVDFHLATASLPSTNPVPISSVVFTNISGTNTFVLTWFAPTNDLFQVQWSSTLPPSWNTFTNIVGYSTFISPTNSEFTFHDNGSQSGGLGSLRFYRLVLYNGAAATSGVVPLVDGVPLNFTTGAGETNFFSFDITQTNASVLFELYNLTGNGDLTLDRGNLPVTAPFFASSANSGTNYEQIVLRTNIGLANLNAVSWFLGVPNQSSNPISYTIRASLPTNGLLVSGLPLDSGAARSGTSNILTWGPMVVGEKYEIRTNSSLLSGNWVAMTDIVATSTSMTFTDPNTSGGSVFYRIVQVP